MTQKQKIRPRTFLHKKLNKEMKYAGAWFTVLFLPQLFLLINFMGEAYPNQFHEKKNGGGEVIR